MVAIEVEGAADSRSTIYVASADDSALVHNLLAPALIVGETTNSRTRQRSKLDAFIRYGIGGGKVIILMYNDIPIGACVYDDHSINTIIYINILEEYRMRRSTGLLMHYLVNVVFEGESVYFTNNTKSYEAIAERDGDNYRIKEFFSEFIRGTI